MTAISQPGRNGMTMTIRMASSAGALNRDPGSPPETQARGPTLALAIEAARTAVDACAAAALERIKNQLNKNPLK